MWIRSQDRLVLGNVCCISRDDNNIKGFTPETEDDFVLGIYESIDRTIEVMDDIQHHIEVGNLRVYQMPEE